MGDGITHAPYTDGQGNGHPLPRGHIPHRVQHAEFVLHHLLEAVVFHHRQIAVPIQLPQKAAVSGDIVFQVPVDLAEHPGLFAFGNVFDNLLVAVQHDVHHNRFGFLVFFVGFLKVGDLHKQQHKKLALFPRRRNYISFKKMILNLDGPAGMGLNPLQRLGGDLIQPAAEQPLQAGSGFKRPVDADNLLLGGHHQSGDAQPEYRVRSSQLQLILHRAHQPPEILTEHDKLIQGVSKSQHAGRQQNPKPQPAGKPGHDFQPGQRCKGNQITGPKTPVFRSHASNFLLMHLPVPKQIGIRRDFRMLKFPSVPAKSWGCAGSAGTKSRKDCPGR